MEASLPWDPLLVSLGIPPVDVGRTLLPVHPPNTSFNIILVHSVGTYVPTRSPTLYVLSLSESLTGVLYFSFMNSYTNEGAKEERPVLVYSFPRKNGFHCSFRGWQGRAGDKAQKRHQGPKERMGKDRQYLGAWTRAFRSRIFLARGENWQVEPKAKSFQWDQKA